MMAETEQARGLEEICNTDLEWLEFARTMSKMYLSIHSYIRIYFGEKWNDYIELKNEC